MTYHRRPDWRIADRQATPEAVFFNRRRFLAVAGLGTAGLALAASPLLAANQAAGGDPTFDLYPVPRNPAYQILRPLTDEGLASTYNNFYEFGSHKRISKAAQRLKTRPWTVEIDGLVEAPMTLDIDDLLRRMPLEERLYRHRCVERWSMTVPWTGFAMKALVDLARPLSGAKFVGLETFQNPKVASGQREFWYPWPYTEGFTLAEATNDLAFLVTGVYGKPLPKQFGAPLRLAVPWKYGFKSIKSIVKVTFTEKQPKTFWETINAREYGFWANVNPDVAHPRWPQAVETPLGTDEPIATQLFNGYAEQVAHLYPDLSDTRFFR